MIDEKFLEQEIKPNEQTKKNNVAATITIEQS